MEAENRIKFEEMGMRKTGKLVGEAESGDVEKERKGREKRECGKKT
jgi:hypothetical protein